MSESKEVQKPQECSIHIDSIVRIIVGKTEQLGSDTRAGFEDWYRRNYKASDTKESMTRKAYDSDVDRNSNKSQVDSIVRVLDLIQKG